MAFYTHISHYGFGEYILTLTTTMWQIRQDFYVEIPTLPHGTRNCTKNIEYNPRVYPVEILNGFIVNYINNEKRTECNMNSLAGYA